MASLSGNTRSKIVAKMPAVVGKEMVTLLEAAGGGITQSAPSSQLERAVKDLLGHEVMAEFVSIMNNVGTGGATKTASTALMVRLRTAFGHDAANELETFFTGVN